MKVDSEVLFKLKRLDLENVLLHALSNMLIHHRYALTERELADIKIIREILDERSTGTHSLTRG